ATTEPTIAEDVAATPTASSTMAPQAFSTQLNAANTSSLPGLSTPTMITSAVVVVLALLAVLAVLIAKSRRGPSLATAGDVEPMPFTPAPEPDEDAQWRRQLLETLEAAAFGEREDEQQNRRPENGPPTPGSEPDPR
ncbi:hypothetical protein, partial [Nonomuraea terrae]|uniref:hypothetical protein n=1 Tax=Nonomuraea terrae TaxID=2530383 RepID=UPI0014043DB7